MKIIITVLAVLCAGVLWDFAFVWWMGDGLAELEGGRRTAAEKVIAHARMHCLDKPIPKFLTRHLYVWVAQQERKGCLARYPYDVQIKVYTFLGLPLMPISRKACEGIWCTFSLEERKARDVTVPKSG